MVTQLIPPNFIEAFLNIILIDNDFIFLNLWSFVHLSSGFLLHRYVTKKFWLLLLILFVYELIEFLLWGVMFKPETGIDMVWDLVIGMLGALISKKLK